jgi:hypothetical protein
LTIGKRWGDNLAVINDKYSESSLAKMDEELRRLMKTIEKVSEEIYKNTKRPTKRPTRCPILWCTKPYGHTPPCEYTKGEFDGD